MATPTPFDSAVNGGIRGVELHCPKCMKRGQLEHAKSRVYYAASQSEGVISWIGQCPHCGLRFLVRGRGERMYPPQLPPCPPEYPGDVAAARGEAIRCRQIGCYEASVLMTRRTLELATSRLYPDTFDLSARVSRAVADGVIPSRPQYSTASILAKLGNEGNHSHSRLYQTDKEGAEIAQRGLDLLDEVLNDMYVKHSSLASLNTNLEERAAVRKALRK